MILLDFLLHYGWSAGSSFHLACFFNLQPCTACQDSVSPAPQQHNRDQPPPHCHRPSRSNSASPSASPSLPSRSAAVVWRRGQQFTASMLGGRLGVDLPLTLGPQQKTHGIIHDMHGTTARRLGRHRCCIMKRVRVAESESLNQVRAPVAARRRLVKGTPAYFPVRIVDLSLSLSVSLFPVIQRAIPSK